MKKTVITSIVLFYICISSQVDASSKIHWAEHWPGEYPSPVVNVTEDVKIPSYSDYKNPKPDESCTLLRASSLNTI